MAINPEHHNSSQSRAYPQTNESLDDLLIRRASVANNRLHSNAAIAISKCKGATDRVVPASLIAEDLDDFICGHYCNFDILARESSTDFFAPICIGDSITFRLIEERSRGPVSKVVIEIWKNDLVLTQTHHLTLFLLAKE